MTQTKAHPKVQEDFRSNESCGVAHEGDQHWLFDEHGFVVGAKVIVDGKEIVAFGSAPEELEILNAKFSQADKRVLPGFYQHSPYTQGGELYTMLQPQDIISAPDWDGDGLPTLEYGTGTLTLNTEQRKMHAMPGIDALCFVAGKPNALYLLDYRNSLLFRYSSSNEDWLEHGDAIPDPLHDQNRKWADALVATPEGVAYTGRQGPVWISLPILGEARTSICPEAICVGPPGISHASERGRPRSGMTGKTVIWPILHKDKLHLAQKLTSGKEWKKTPVKVEGDLPKSLEFAPPVISSIGNLWICREGVLMLSRGSNEATFRPWPNGLKAIHQARPIVDDVRTMWILAETADEKNYVIVQLTQHGVNLVNTIGTPYLSAGERCYDTNQAFTLDDSGVAQPVRGDPIPAMPGFTDPFFFPIHTFKPTIKVDDPAQAAGITLGLQIDDVNARRPFLVGGPGQPQRLTRLMMHMPGAPVVDLKTVFDIKSAASLATFRYNDRIYAHSREKNQCYSWPVSFS